MTDINELIERLRNLATEFHEACSDNAFLLATSEGERYVKDMTEAADALEKQADEYNFGLLEQAKSMVSRNYWRGEAARLTAIVERLPKTADGVPVAPGDEVYVGPQCPHTNIHPVGTQVTMRMSAGYEGEIDPSDCYSTPEAATQ